MDDMVQGALQDMNTYSIGWDVDGWNCDSNANSRDAVVILDDTLTIVGKSWRGNLRKTINESKDSISFIRGLFARCKAGTPAEGARFTLAIDTPLGFPDEFMALVTGLKPIPSVGECSGGNPYLFRWTERYLFEKTKEFPTERRITPLSPVKDMIGSQATKGMHVLGKFAPELVRCGVWSDGGPLTVIEAYPSACKRSKTICSLCKKVKDRPSDPDEMDALFCALVAHLFEHRPDKLEFPVKSPSEREGWIWVPTDALQEGKS
jgi:hypothetical protein